jgi:hypothetical protein
LSLTRRQRSLARNLAPGGESSPALQWQSIEAHTMASKDPETLRAATAPEKQPLLARSDEPNHEKQHPSIWLDAKDTIVLAAPIFLSILSWVGMKTTDSALLGHVSSDALAAAALSDLVRY